MSMNPNVYVYVGASMSVNMLVMLLLKKDNTIGQRPYVVFLKDSTPSHQFDATGSWGQDRVMLLTGITLSRLFKSLPSPSSVVSELYVSVIALVKCYNLSSPLLKMGLGGLLRMGKRKEMMSRCAGVSLPEGKGIGDI